jgi:Leucine-rich repeat (LRR) protein
LCRVEIRAEVASRVRVARETGKLDLLGFALRSLPSSIARHLPALKSLAVNTNSLEALPEGVGQFRSLQELNVRYNLLEALPDFAPNSSLTSIDASNNQLACLPASVSNLGMLQTLDLNTNALARLPDQLCRMSSLRTLTLRSNKLSELPTDVDSLPSLTCLDAASNALSSLPASVGYLKTLLTLDVSKNQLRELPTSIGTMACLQRLLAASNQQLWGLPSFSGMVSLRVLALEGCSVCELPSVTENHGLRELRLKGNPLQRPPASVAAHGLEAIRRYFIELEAAGASVSRCARLVLLGDGMAGKTSLQRGLKSGGTPSPTTVDARTIQLDISELTLFEDRDDVEPVTFSVWDLGGQVQYAAAQQPYIAPGSLYVLVIPAPRAADRHHAEVVARWLQYLQAGAPGAYVLPVLTQCDRLLPEGSNDRSVAALDAAAATQSQWVRRALYWHQVRLGGGTTRLRFHENVMCVSSVSGGEASLRRFRATLEAIATSSPPKLLSIGQTIPRSWSYAAAMLRALRDGAEPVAAAHAAKEQLEERRRRASAAAEAGAPSRAARMKPITQPAGIASLARPYITMSEAQLRWRNAVAPALQVAAEQRVLHDALQLLVNQGEVFASCGCIYLQPAHVTSLLKPLVDHRLDVEWAVPRAYEYTGELYEDSPAVRPLLAAVEVLRASGELREELLPMLWEVRSSPSPSPSTSPSTSPSN